MHIVLDSNIYAADYRMNGVAFQSLFEYLRRTESRLVLPRAIREEVVIGYGRRLKAEAKAFADAYRKYRILKLDSDNEDFRKPDGKHEMIRLRRKLMKPADGIVPIYFPEITGGFLQEAFMRGIHRTRPANEDGEELRDVILWLWTLAYSDTADTDVAFVSGDGGFWGGDEIHPDIVRDTKTKGGRIHVYRSIQNFLKSHAPTPVEITVEWAHEHFKIQNIERELIDRGARELSRATRDIINGLSIKEHNVQAGKLYDVSDDAQFAELNLRLTFSFLRTSAQLPETNFITGYQTLGFFTGLRGNVRVQDALASRLQSVPYLSNIDRLLANPELPLAEQVASELECKADAHISLRIKQNKTTEISVDTLQLDRSDLLSLLKRD